MVCECSGIVSAWAVEGGSARRQQLPCQSFDGKVFLISVPYLGEAMEQSSAQRFLKNESILPMFLRRGVSNFVAVMHDANVLGAPKQRDQLIFVARVDPGLW